MRKALVTSRLPSPLPRQWLNHSVCVAPTGKGYGDDA